MTGASPSNGILSANPVSGPLLAKTYKEPCLVCSLRGSRTDQETDLTISSGHGIPVAEKRPVQLSIQKMQDRETCPFFKDGALILGTGTALVSPEMKRTVTANLSEEAMRNVECESKVVTSMTGCPSPRRPSILSCVPRFWSTSLRMTRPYRRCEECSSLWRLIVTVPYQKPFRAEDDEHVAYVRQY
jgi:hypothetical protein